MSVLETDSQLYPVTGKLVQSSDTISIKYISMKLQNMVKQHIFTQMISEQDEPALYINPRSEQIAAFAEEAVTVGDQSKVRLLADTGEIKDAFYSFLTASKIAELIRRDQLSLRTLREPVQNTIFTTESETVVPVMGKHSISGSDPELVSSVYSEFDSRFEAAEQYHLRTPALSVVKETLREEIGDSVADELTEVLAHADEIANSNEYLSIVEIILILAARNEILLYDVSKWGEDTDIASKATFSRAKTALEDAGLIETEKVPVNIGRPRLRLIETDELATADLKTLSTEIQSPL
ncbi:transcriptional regulator TbsP domain-containing protein [Halorubrum sp. N11]|uniref:transcriptional regulator TbsP domain-containing protein n=1 Tax=Halorubrum sp. N11 TaxID=3402276 RepID=UPI003EB9F260